MSDGILFPTNTDDPWNKLTQHEQQPYLDKAKYLISHNYILDYEVTEESLGRRIYLSALQETTDGTPSDSGVRGEGEQ